MCATLDRWLSLLPRRDWPSWALCGLVIAVAVAVRVMFPLAGPFLSFYPAVLFRALFGFLIVTAIDFQQRTLGTSRRLTERLTAQQHFTDSVIAAAPSLTYIYDVVTGENLFISPQSTAILGYEPQEVAAMGKTVLRAVLHPTSNTACAAATAAGSGCSAATAPSRAMVRVGCGRFSAWPPTSPHASASRSS